MGEVEKREEVMEVGELEVEEEMGEVVEEEGEVEKGEEVIFSWAFLISFTFFLMVARSLWLDTPSACRVVA
ncbi:hypothetical protein CRUP_003550 [Coryphaenoides rupestris]|nr:hypothetical protein CRUP_003550 [Coryphaenoides rupestris]